MSRIDNPQQLQQLHLRYTAVEGALAAAQAAQQSAEVLARQYVDLLSLLTGQQIQAGARIHIDWDTGDVEIGEQTPVMNGVTYAA